MTNGKRSRGLRYGPRLRRRSVSWLLAVLLVGSTAALSAAAQTFTDLVVFGDSLSDTGNACPLLAIAGYRPGGCSNGDVWIESLAAELGLEATASLSGGSNYAVGGHLTSDFADQLFAFSPFGIVPADPDALYVVWFGGNDVLALPGSPGAMANAVDAVLAGIRALQGLGAQHFLIPNLPDIGRAYGGFTIPAGSGAVFTPLERDFVTALSLDFNDRLAAALAVEPIDTLYVLDIETMVEQLFADPAAFGIAPAAIDDGSDDTDFGVPCLIDPVCAADPQGAVADGFFLFDAIHPTTAGHALIAERAAILLPEPTFVGGLWVGLSALSASARRRSRLGALD